VAPRYQDWFRQAKRDLDLARQALDGGYYEWACFAAQQSAEKGVRALFLRINRTAWGHSVTALLQQLPPPWEADESLVDAAKHLDSHYVPPRYPNSFPQGAPYDYYTQSQAERAISHSELILAFCERLLAERGASEERSSEGGTAPGP